MLKFLTVIPVKAMVSTMYGLNVYRTYLSRMMLSSINQRRMPRAAIPRVIVPAKFDSIFALLIITMFKFSKDAMLIHVA